MSNNAVSDKRIVIELLIGCVLAILLFTFAWWSKFTHNLSNPVFAIGYGLLLGACLVEGIGVYRCMDDDRKDGKRKLLLLFAVLLLGWLGGWASGSNEKKMFEQDVEKAKQSAFSIQNYNEMFHLVTPEEALVRDIVYLDKSSVLWIDDRSMSEQMIANAFLNEGQIQILPPAGIIIDGDAPEGHRRKRHHNVK